MKNLKTLLCIGLLGSIIVSLGILFSKSYVVMAEDEHSFSRFFYEGIESITENVYSIDFWNKNVMFVTGGENSIFHMSNIPVIIKNANNVISGGISNILGGYNVQLWNSNNITVIGGESKVDGGNTNATLFGGQGNLISGSMSSDTPTVLLGGVNNVVDAGHDANAIVGGASNFIGEDSKNVNILGGTSISIDGNDVIAGGQQLRGEISDSFVFSDGNYDGIMDLEGSGMFFLNVANGVGLGILTQQGNQGVVSNGAVNVGYVDIDHTNCTQLSSENIGLMGVWNGCMVGCTSGSAMQSKWEMLGYGDLCEHLCDSSDKCIVHPVNPWNIDYTSFCTEGLVNTGNASMCPNLSLGAYHNVMFETYLIDSDAGCPTTGYNQCVYRCNSDSHLLKDETGKKGRKTMCYRDCQMPGNSGVMKKHNEVITAYSTGDTYCSSEPGNHDSCANYKKKLMCVDGTWYEMNGNEVTDTINTIYNYDSCTLHDYTCGDEFSLTRENIVNDKKDFVEIWRYGNTNNLLSDFVVNKIITPHLGFVQYSDIERNDDEPQQEAGATQMGIRGKYTLCIQYNPVTTPSNQYPGNEEGCVESSPLPEQYRYRFDECNEGYELADDGVCRKLCEYDGKLIQHGSGIVLYSGSYATCPITCEGNSKQFICYDGTLYADLQVGENGGFTSGVAQNSTPYTQTGCTVECPQCGPANGKEYETLPTLEYILCTGSTLSGGVTTTETEFTWTCMTGHSSVNCSAIHGNNFTYEDLDIYFLTDEGNIGNYTLMDRNLGATAYMGEQGKSIYDWYGNYYQWGNNYGFPNRGDVDTTTEKADVLGYGPGEYLNNSFYVYNGSPSIPEGNWFIEPNHDLWGNVTDTVEARQGPCPDEYHVPTSDEFVNLVYDWGEYGYNIDRNEYCTSFGTPTGFLYGPTWSSDFLMPFGGDRRINSNIAGQGQFGYLQTSSIFGGSSSIHSSYLYYSTLEDCVTTVGTYDGGAINSVSYGYPIRCMKNFTNSNLTIHSNGGTGAMIIVHGNEVTKLGTPTKGNMILEGWYSDSEFTSRVEIGSTVPSDLYAKWGCEDGYVQSGDMCVLGAQCGPANRLTYGDNSWFVETNTNLCSGSLPQNLVSTETGFEWRCVVASSSVNCSATRSVNNYECEGDDPMFDNEYAEIVSLVSGATAQGQQKTLYRNLAEAQAHSCSYVCTGGYEFLPNPNRCVRCVELTEERENGVLVACSEIIDACGENYHYVVETHQCVAYGNCTWKGGVKNNIPENANITDMSLVRPIGVNKEWNCKTDEANVNPNKCQFACTGDFICRTSNDNYPGCTTLSCSPTNKNGRFYAEKSENPVQFKQSGNLGPNGGWWYGEGRKYLESENTGHFQSQVENRPGCYFWCPEELLCRLDYYRKRPTDYEGNWTCYASVEEKENDCVEVQEYECSGVEYHILHGDVIFDTTAYGQDREFQIFYTPGEYRNHISEGCYRGCRDGSTLIETEEYGPICWKQCSQNQYFDITNRSLASPCKRCSDWQKPNTGDLFNGSPISCIDKCADGRLWGPNYGEDGGEGCILTVYDAGSCPEGARVIQEDGQIKCVIDL